MSKALELADQLKSRYGANVLTSQAAAELRRLAAVEAELERIRALEPVAWRYKKEGGGWFVSDNEPQYVEQWNDLEESRPLIDLTPKDPT